MLQSLKQAANSHYAKRWACRPLERWFKLVDYTLLASLKSSRYVPPGFSKQCT